MSVELPHTCPECGARFGWGPDAALLSVVSSVPFDEPAPCCGRRIRGVVSSDLTGVVSVQFEAVAP